MLIRMPSLTPCALWALGFGLWALGELSTAASVTLAKALEVLVRECGVSLVTAGDLVESAWTSRRARA